ALSRQTGSTLFMTLMAAFATLLYRYSGQSDVVIGSPIANRNRSEIESSIGFFVNTLVLRTRLEDNPRFEQLLTQVRENTLTAYEHQDVPFEQIVEALQPQRSMSHSPLFQVMFTLQNTPLGEIELPSVKLSELNTQSTIAKFDLTLSISESLIGLECEWEYNTDLFDKSTIERMASHFENLLSAIVANPHQTLSELPLLSESERHQLLFDWNNTAREYPQDKCIHQLFEEQVAKTPKAIAVVFEQQELTYQQLNHRANQLAHHLQTLGVKPEVLVGICVERSLEMVVGLLGILKAGGAYVPLDPSYPTERLSYMVSDAEIEVLLTQENLLSTLPSHVAQVVCLDPDGGVIESHSPENLVTSVSAANLAYVIYTSGSTGAPKGVQICHSSVVNFLSDMRCFPGVSPEDTFNAVTTISFDIAALELYLPLLVGAKIWLVSSEVATDGERLLSELSRSRITVMQATPATWQMLLASGWSCDYPLKVLCGGEALSARLAHQILETGSELWNLYGPTEVTIWSLIAHLRVVTTENKPSAIGRPIANTQVYILDSQLQPVPIGVAGELHIGGDGLARGYLNRPELTAEKFIPNPFSPDSSARLYKTGDLARYQPDGNIEFLGRIDHQVKIRGFRIELGEIEAVLSSHPHVRQAVAIATEDPTGNQRLIAYVVSEQENLSTQKLREFLQQQLPAYMVPAAFVTLDTLPLTPNGKVDRKALPAPDGEIERTQEYVAPHTPNQEIVAHIFTTVLGVEKVGIHDNFFELGGHSLLATQLTSRLKHSFTVDIPLRAVFEAPTVVQLERTITQLRTQKQGWSLPAIERIAPSSESIPLSFAQERLWFLNQLEGASATYNIPAALRLTGDLNLDAFDRSLTEIVRRHEALRTSFNAVNGTPMQVIQPAASMDIAVTDLQHLTDTEREVVLEQH
ncbi:non-ribosomal peptide synthetase, partial [Chamaesiphon polymorphus]